MINLQDYKQFVLSVTSETSKDVNLLKARLDELNNDCNVATLLTASIGLAGESGEFNDIIKKCVFQGKSLSSETVAHCKKELGDIIFYWIESCLAFNLDPQSVIDENFTKLSARYPNGFSVAKSEQRAAGDL